MNEARLADNAALRLRVRVILVHSGGQVGIELLEALIPDPLDALELLVDFAGPMPKRGRRSASATA
jgi:hypothetical protein